MIVRAHGEVLCLAQEDLETIREGLWNVRQYLMDELEACRKLPKHQRDEAQEEFLERKINRCKQLEEDLR